MVRNKINPPEQDRTIIVVKDGNGYEFRIWNRLMGDAPIGARLAKKDGLPNLPTRVETFQTAIGLLVGWQKWLEDQPLTGRGKGKRR